MERRRLARRQLEPTPAQVIEALGAEAKEKLEQGRKVGGENARRGRPNSSEPTSAQSYDRAPQVRDKIADMFDVGKTTVSQGKMVMSESPLLAADVMNGKT